MRRSGTLGIPISLAGSIKMSTRTIAGMRLSGPAVMLFWHNKHVLAASCPGVDAEWD
jgi:lysophospholipid acyltransferase (LPLAT)-like uncharacterized protein